MLASKPPFETWKPRNQLVARACHWDRPEEGQLHFAKNAKTTDQLSYINQVSVLYAAILLLYARTASEQERFSIRLPKLKSLLASAFSRGNLGSTAGVPMSFV